MNPSNLPSLEKVKNYYDVLFDDFAIAMFHPVTTEYKSIRKHAKNFVKALIESDANYILIYPNNDLGSEEILEEFDVLKRHNKIKVFP